MATTRVVSSTVTFGRPFILDGLGELQRPGSYVIDTEEEMIDASSVVAWKRISTAMRLSRHGGIEYVPINSDQLNDALRRDGAQHDPAGPVSAISAKGRHDRARRLLALPFAKVRQEDS